MSMIVNVPTGTTSVDQIATNPLMQGFSESGSVNFDNLLRQCYAVADPSDARKDSSANTKASSGQMQREPAKKSTDESGTTAQKQAVSDTRGGKQAKGADNIQKKDATQNKKSNDRESERKDVRAQNDKEERVSDANAKCNLNADKSLPSDSHEKVPQDKNASVAATVSEDATAAVNLDEYAQVNIDDAVLEDADVLVDIAAETDLAAEVPVVSGVPSDDSSVLAQNEERTAYIQTLNDGETGYDNSFLSMPGEILSMLREARSVSSECVTQQEAVTVSAAELAAVSRSNGLVENAEGDAIDESENIEISQSIDAETAESIDESDVGESAILRQLLARSTGIAADNSKASASQESADVSVESSSDSVNVVASVSADSLEQNAQSENDSSDNPTGYRETARADSAKTDETASDDVETAIFEKTVLKTAETPADQTVAKSAEQHAPKTSEKPAEASSDQTAANSADRSAPNIAGKTASENASKGDRVVREQTADVSEKTPSVHEEIRAVSSDSQAIRMAVQQEQSKNPQVSGSKSLETSAGVANLETDNVEELSADKKGESLALQSDDAETVESSAKTAGKDSFQKSFVATLREAMLNGHQTREGNQASLAKDGMQDIRQQAETGISSGSLGTSSGSFADAKADSAVAPKSVSDISGAQPMDKAMNAKTLNPLEAAKEMQKPLRMSQSYEENARQISEKINIMIARNLKTAEVNLDPLNLGKMRININMSEEGVAKVGMVVQNAETKDVIYESLGKLKEALQEAGIKLGDADVKHDDGRGAQASQNDGGSQTNENHSGKMAGVVADESAEERLEAEIVADDLSSAVNYYA